MASHPNTPTVRVSDKKNQAPLAFGAHTSDPGLKSIYDEYFPKAEQAETVLEVTYEDLLALHDEMPEKMKEDREGNFPNWFVTAPDSYIYQLVRWARSEGGYDDVSIVGEMAQSHKCVEDLRAQDINSLVSLKVRCTDRTENYTRLAIAEFQCRDCGERYTQSQSRASGKVDKPKGCDACGAGVRSLEVQHDGKDTEFLDIQQCLVQDLHTEASSANPLDIKAELDGHLIHALESGDTAVVTAIVRAEENDEKESKMYLQIVGVEHLAREFRSLDLTKEDINQIKELSERDDLYEVLSKTPAPGIKGDYTLARRALLYQMFGGVSRSSDAQHHRGDIHVAFVGDSGVGKSKLARGTVHLVPTAQYKSADNVTEAGLTAAATHEDRFDTSKWTLTGGALVRSDQGHCVIDELDKGSENIQHSLQEAMSEQQVSVSKASIDATLPARCSVLLVANPKNGRFDTGRNLDEQIDINTAIWDRLDIIVPFTDEPDDEKDAAIADGILGRAQGEEDEPLDSELVRKYVAYAKRIEPTMSDEARDYLEDEWKELRSNDRGKVVVGARQLEAMVRISEASARMRLSETVELEDAKRAFDIMKTWMSLLMTDDHGNWDIDALGSGPTQSEQDKENAMWRAINEHKDDDGVALWDDVTETMEDRYEVEEAYQVINGFLGSGELAREEDEDGNRILIDQR